MKTKKETLKMLEIWRDWETTINDIGLDAAVLSAMGEYAEAQIKNLNLHNVNKRSELLIAFTNWMHEKEYYMLSPGLRKRMVQQFLKAINCC